MPMSALEDFVVNVADLEQSRLRLAASDPRSRAGTPRQDAGCRKIMERAVHGHARRAEAIRELRLGRHPIALGPCAAVDLVEHEPLDSLVERTLVVRAPGQLERALAADRSCCRFQHALDNLFALVQILLP